MQTSLARPLAVNPTLFPILFAISFVHLCNDSLQSAIPALNPLLMKSMNLSYTQIGWILFSLNLTASIMQPLVGWYTDKKPSPYLLPLGMASSLTGMVGLALAPNYVFILLSVIFVGLGSAVFHPEASRVAYMAAGPRRGLAQSIFQVGGNTGQALQSILTLMIFIPFGQFGAIWFTVIAGFALIMQFFIARWYKDVLASAPPRSAKKPGENVGSRPAGALRIAILLIVFLVFVRSWYSAGITNFYQYHIVHEFGMSLERAQSYILLFMMAGVAGTFLGGPLADRFGKSSMIWFSMLGSAPFALLLPYADPTWSYVLCLLNGFILMSGFSVMVVYAQELFPGKIGTVSGLTIGLAFGMGAVGSVGLGKLIDTYNVKLVMEYISFLPLLGIVTVFLPSDKKIRQWSEESEGASAG